MTAGIEVFAICAAGDIAPGEAKAFSVSRIDAAGEVRPLPMVIVRTSANAYFGYVNICPHNKTWLNIADGGFFSDDRAFLRCGRHGSRFEIDTGLCVAGACEGESLEPLAIAVVGGDVCVCGLTLVEEDGFPDPFAEYDDTMEIMIHPD